MSQRVWCGAGDWRRSVSAVSNATMNLPVTLPRYSLREEIANSFTSGIGLVLAVAGSAVLITLATKHGTVWHIVSCSVYGATLISLYAVSTIYHGSVSPRLKPMFRSLDHSPIFLLIAGTYTPFTLVNLRGAWGWSLLGAVWGLGVLGIIFQAWLRRRPVASVGLYVGMGWTGVVAIKPVFAAVAPGGLVLLLVGGLAYILGLGFYAWRRLPYHHAIWHVFVLAGTISHFFAILLYVIPSSLAHS